MPVISVAPAASTAPLLAGAGFADAFCLTVNEPGLDAISASHRIFNRTPAWISRLLRLRNLLVAPLGLKGTLEAEAGAQKQARIGFFPVVSQNAQRVVLGFDDKHLDFRVVVDAATDNGGSSITATTLVRQHNLMGRAYLALVLPASSRQRCWRRRASLETAYGLSASGLSGPPSPGEKTQRPPSASRT